MSVVNTLTLGLVYRDGECPKFNRSGGWSKRKGGTYWVSGRLLELPIYIRHLPTWIISLFGAAWAQKIIGDALGFGSCAHCGMPWKYVRGKTISYCESSGMFPVCVKCFAELPPEAIDYYIKQLVNQWVDMDKKLGHEWSKTQTPLEIVAAASAEVRRMKGVAP